MIKLDERDVRLIQRVQRTNFSDYGIVTINDGWYISENNLLLALEDAQESREYAEDRILDLCEELDKRPEECNSLQLTTLSECKRLKEENNRLKEMIENIQKTLDEDDYDKLAMEGIEL